MSEHAQRLWEQTGRPTPPDIQVYQRSPSNYAQQAALIDLAMEFTSRPCSPEGCDLDAPCRRHARAGEAAARLLRWRQRQSRKVTP